MGSWPRVQNLPLRAGALRVLFVLALLLSARPAFAQLVEPQLELRVQPSSRAQFAVWVESADGTFKGTLALTHAVAKAGIGNRPGALQFNSGFRWPYGRREGVLPVWAHARLAAPGAKPFHRVIFQNRKSEGFASRTASDQSRDDYYCLSFARDTTNRDALDAVTCASVFSSDKGRFATTGDVAAGYAEPYESAPGKGALRPLSTDSLYPPRRDVSRCLDASCYDHADVANYASHALEVMPELDAITQATPQGNTPVSYRFGLPPDWPIDADYTLYMEVNVEGDYGEGFDNLSYPTPTTPAEDWDSWAVTFGYPYRGQPSVVYALPFRIDAPNTFNTLDAVGTGALEGDDGDLHSVDGRAIDDPAGAPGSGVDRLRVLDGARLRLNVIRPDPALCARTSPAPAVQNLRVSRYAERAHAHTWANLSFEAPTTERHVVEYDVLVRAEGGGWEPAFTPDDAEQLLPVALDMCRDMKAPNQNRCTGMQGGETMSVVLAGLKQTTNYEIQVTPRDQACGAAGESATTTFETPARVFSTVTPCFIATAAYGTPLAREISVLRAFRDRQLASNALGRAVIRGYYAFGPTLADAIAERPTLRAITRTLLAPLVSLLAWWQT